MHSMSAAGAIKARMCVCVYVCRSDPQYPVRTEALHVWKSVVPNTPRTLGQVGSSCTAKHLHRYHAPFQCYASVCDCDLRCALARVCALA